MSTETQREPLSEVPDPAPPSSRWSPLVGGTAVWVFMGVEVGTFGLFLLAHSWMYAREPEVFAQSQALLHPGSAARGTAILLIGSWFAYQGALLFHAGKAQRASRWMAAASVSGVLFSANKIVEYASPELADITLSTNGFWFSYLFLTGLHLLHVIGGVGLFAWLSWAVAQDRLGDDPPISVDAGAAYWHLVDLVWVLLFPILYLMHS